ncbi:uncharacterized protein LACBIDRAFT_313418 [Laccaria bicolor S238N-H82]|uniref:Predicted protein n=1 Tax=Laccaria bicolor (strain S238N-H82 / ATCC MYA-4686) TaxID=486041 RepID=B0D003_LACBS|nr:uncharacterized protein LACBIDRAFT_313418 [Laccaria bicolor S238N-H82]EDR11372.1 predicted protein [Laccaria bicolor S238N-H82]|eukprot:XP_001877269.1 predicted protein [Laccaria bicolor S238N-H82]
MWLFGHSPLLIPQNFSRTPRDALCAVTSMIYHPTAAISARDTSNHWLWTGRAHRVESPSCVSIRSSSSPLRNVAHTDVPIAEWALVTSD